MKVKKKVLSIILTLCMVLTLLPTVAFAADDDPAAMQLGTSGVADKDFVYFGNYNSADIKWKVLDADADNAGGTNAMFLLSEYLLVQNNVPFEAAWYSDDGDGQTNPNEWQHSDAQNWCTTFAGSDAFTPSEKSALKGVSKSDAQTTQYGISWGTSSLVDEKVFYLSAEEAATYIGPNNGNTGLATATSGSAAGGWWLRSPDLDSTNEAGFVYADGYVSDGSVVSIYPGVRPAFNLNLNSVLFSSAAVGGKSSGTVGAAALNSVSEYTSDTARAWKVTLLDTNRENFTAQAADGTATSAAAGYSNWSVNVTYNNALTDTNEYVSAMLCNASGNVLYYGNIAQSSASGTQAVTIPAGLAVGNYTLKVFSEQSNGDNKTDYASAFKDIALEVTLPKAATPSAVFTATSEDGGTLSGVTTNMQYSVDSGANWIDVTDTTMNIADVTATNGVQVYAKGNGTTTSNSDAQTLAVTQAVKPAGLTKTDCTSAANNDGKISGVKNTMEYRVSGSADAWTAVTGATITGLSNQSYDVRIKASGTVLASEAQSIAISAYVAPPTRMITVNQATGGSITVNPTSGKAGDTITVTATPNNGYKLKNILVDGVAITGNTFAMKDANAVVTAEFEKINYTVTVKQATGGKITVSPATATIGDTVTVTATPNSGYKLKNILVDGKAITGNTFVIKDANATVTAEFEKVTTSTNTNSPQTNSPQTGDNSNIILWVALLFVSAGGVLSTVLITKKRRKSVK